VLVAKLDRLSRDVAFVNRFRFMASLHCWIQNVRKNCALDGPRESDQSTGMLLQLLLQGCGARMSTFVIAVLAFLLGLVTPSLISVVRIMLAPIESLDPPRQ
jgi:hypothetical protein